MHTKNNTFQCNVFLHEQSSWIYVVGDVVYASGCRILVCQMLRLHAFGRTLLQMSRVCLQKTVMLKAGCKQCS
jgi:hypothetical protein